eukprot:1254909-Rhodomonas_salina.1
MSRSQSRVTPIMAREPRGPTDLRASWTRQFNRLISLSIASLWSAEQRYPKPRFFARFLFFFPSFFVTCTRTIHDSCSNLLVQSVTSSVTSVLKNVGSHTASSSVERSALNTNPCSDRRVCVAAHPLGQYHTPHSAIRYLSTVHPIAL